MEFIYKHITQSAKLSITADSKKEADRILLIIVDDPDRWEILESFNLIKEA